MDHPVREALGQPLVVAADMDQYLDVLHSEANLLDDRTPIEIELVQLAVPGVEPEAGALPLPQDQESHAAILSSAEAT